MEFYDKFMDRFQDIKSKESCCQQGKRLAITYSLQKQIFGGVIWHCPLTMLYLKIFHDMCSQNSEIIFSDAAIMS